MKVVLESYGVRNCTATKKLGLQDIARLILILYCLASIIQDNNRYNIYIQL